MQSIKFIAATTLLLIFSCSNLGEQSSKDLKNYRGTNAFETVLTEVLKEDKDLADFIDKVEERMEKSGGYSLSRGNWKTENGPDAFISRYYANVTNQINSIADSTQRMVFDDLRKANEEEFLSKLQSKIDLGNEINQLENQLEQLLLKLKVRKTLAFMKKYQAEKTFDINESTKERDELRQLIETVQSFE